MTYDFSGKVVLITGGTGVLGRAVAQAFGTFNATTVVTYIIDEDREGVKAKIKTIATFTMSKAALWAKHNSRVFDLLSPSLSALSTILQASSDIVLRRARNFITSKGMVSTKYLLSTSAALSLMN